MKRLLASLLLSGLSMASLAFAGPADDAFRAIYEKEWAWRQSQFPGYDEDRDASVGARMPDVGAAAQKARLGVWTQVLKDLDGVDLTELSAENRVNYAVYRPQIENLAAGVRLRDYEMPFNADSQFWSGIGFMARRPLKNAEAAQAYIDKLNDLPRYFNDQIANMRTGLKRGFSVPRAVLDGREVSITAVSELTDPRQSELYAPFNHLQASIPAEEQERLREAAADAIRNSVIPSYGRLLTFFRKEYVPRARKTLAAEAMPGGKAYYRQQIREYTTLDLDPEQIHQMGLDEVARIHAEMLETMRASGFEGSFDEFLTFLRTDPQFYPKTGEELLMRAAWISKQVDGKLAQFFGTIPRGRFSIEPVPDAIAPFWTAGRGGAHTYWLNLYNLPSRPLYNLPALTLHESSPGHALQGSLVEEQTGVPDFRREYISAYGEGWALYTEKLGREMGIYKTPYEEFGRLTYEMWRACRLVIDTGIHHKGWTRDQALAYLREHTALSEHEVTTEVDRYISWPAQALSYKLGELKILELRARAERELGIAFDIRAFHDTILAQGSVPLGVLDSQIDAWIASVKAVQP